MFLQRIGNRGLSLGSLFERAAARHPTNVVILDHDLDIAPGLGRRATVAEIADLVDDVAARLWAASVRPGDPVVVHKSHGFDITLLACAAARIGAVPVLLSPMLDEQTVVALIRRVGRPFLVTDTATLDRLPAEVGSITSGVVLASELAAPGRDRVPRVPAVSMPPDHPALVTHTSGTTGLPKLAVHTMRTLQARYRPQAAVVVPLLRRRETVAIHVSFVHSRLVTALALALRHGCPLLLLAYSDPGRVADLFAALRPGVLEAHPNSLMEWEELADDPRGPLANVTLFSSTFDAIHPRTVHSMLAASRRPTPVFGQLYGQSEVGPVVGRLFTRGRAPDADGRCVGIPFPAMTGVRVVSRNDRAVAPDNPGYIEVRSDGRAVTYFGERARYQAQVSRDGWWRMGDVGYRTRWGCLHLLDREVDMIDGFGSTLAGEDVLFGRLPELTEVVIVPDADDGAVAVVCTRGDEPLDPERWRAAVADMAPLGPPLHWRHADLPQTATTKIKRLELARMLAVDGRAA